MSLFRKKKIELIHPLHVDDSMPTKKFFDRHKFRGMAYSNQLTRYVGGKKVRIWKCMGFSNEHRMYIPLFFKDDKTKIQTLQISLRDPSKVDYPYETDFDGYWDCSPDKTDIDVFE